MPKRCEQPYIVQVSNLSMQIGQRTILDNINFAIHPGEIVTIIGPNGGGKSTLLRIILGLIQPTNGTVTIANHTKVGYMPQKIKVESLMPLTVARFLLLAPNATKTECMSIAQQLAIEHFLDVPIQSVSGGELQRVLLARALLNKPNLLVLDEPAQGVDINGQVHLYQLITQMRKQLGCSILMVSHDLHLVIAGTDRVICLNQHVCCSGHPAAITQDPEFIKLFGANLASGLALYTHHHDHDHNL